MLKIKKDFECKEVLGDYMVIPKGDAMQEFSGTLVLSESAAAAWEVMEKGCTMEELVDAVYEQFDAEKEEIAIDMAELVGRLRGYGILEEGA